MQGFDVAVIGAGPAGSAAAISLAQRGFAVALIDKQFFPREKLCGDFVNPINRPVLDALGALNSLLARPHAKVSGFRVTSISGSEAESNFPHVGGESTFGIGVRRAVLDQTLLDRATSLGVTVRLGNRVEHLLRTSQGWQLNPGSGEVWRAKALIGADGRNSWVAEQLGMNSSAPARGRAVGFQLRLKCSGAMPDKVEIHLFPGGYAGTIGLGSGEVNLCLAIERKYLPRIRVRQYLLGDCLPRNPHLKALLARSRQISQFRSAYPVYFSKRRCVGDGVLLAGDAARVTEPITGEGIYFALRSGMLAAETLDRALRKGDLSAGFLRRYEGMCARVLGSRLWLNSFLRFGIYRPALVDPLIRWSVRHNRVLGALVDTVCAPAAGL